MHAAWWGLRGLCVNRGTEVGGPYIFILQKRKVLQIIGLKMSLVQIEAVWQHCVHSVTISYPQRAASLTGSKEGSQETPSMPADLNGYWKMISNDNFEEYLKALGEYKGETTHCISSFVNTSPPCTCSFAVLICINVLKWFSWPFSHIPCFPSVKTQM